jgi:hypothetical protein
MVVPFGSTVEGLGGSALELLVDRICDLALDGDFSLPVLVDKSGPTPRPSLTSGVAQQPPGSDHRCASGQKAGRGDRTS